MFKSIKKWLFNKFFFDEYQAQFFYYPKYISKCDPKTKQISSYFLVYHPTKGFIKVDSPPVVYDIYTNTYRVTNINKLKELRGN